MKDIVDSIKDFSNKKILVLGDVMLDKYIWGDIRRLNPDNPVAPLINVTGESYILGGAANVANNIVSLGANVCLISSYGNDSNGEIFSNLCREKGINSTGLLVSQPTIVKQRVIAHDKQIVRLDFGEDNLEKICKKDQIKLCSMIESSIKLDNFDAAILSDYNKFFFVDGFTQKIIDICNNNGIRVFTDPKPVNINQFRNSYVISPNLKEAENITGIKYSNEDSLTKISRKLSEVSNSEKVIITCGEKGVFGYNKITESGFLREAKAKKVSDQTGAGDTFISAYTLADLSGFDFNYALDVANHAAAVVVGKVGTATLNQEELINSLKGKVL